MLDLSCDSPGYTETFRVEEHVEKKGRMGVGALCYA